MILDADDEGNLVIRANGHDGEAHLSLKDGSVMIVAEKDGRIESSLTVVNDCGRGPLFIWDNCQVLFQSSPPD